MIIRNILLFLDLNTYLLVTIVYFCDEYPDINLLLLEIFGVIGMMINKRKTSGIIEGKKK
jgi:hypothetical protein